MQNCHPLIPGVPLLALGWKYKRGSTLCYIATKDAGSTADDCNNPYKMRIKDLEGNPIDRQVLRPEIIGTYYRMNAGIDVHNQQRQGDLALEKVWLTREFPYFRIFSSLVVICATDAFNLRKYRLAHRRLREDESRKKWTFKDYVNALSVKLMNNSWEGEIFRRATPRDNNAVITSITPGGEHVQTLIALEAFRQHKFARLPDSEGRHRATKQVRCSVCGGCTSFQCVGEGCTGRTNSR